MPAAFETLLFKKGSHLAVLGEDDEFWVCYNSQNVFLNTDEFNIGWFERDEDGNDVYVKKAAINSVSLSSVICRLSLLPVAAKPRTYRLPDKERLKVEKTLEKARNGYKINVYEKSFKEERTCDVIVMEGPDDEEDGDKRVKGKKRKADAGEGKKESKRKKATTKKPKGEGKPKEKKAARAKKPTKEKKEKKPVDKTDPNRRLKPNDSITVWEKDPLFETDTPVPFVSSQAHSKLAIRAVLLKNKKLLEQCHNNGAEVMSLDIKRSVACQMTALEYAIKNENFEAVKYLLNPKKKKVVRAPAPNVLLKKTGTGIYNYRSLGIKKIRRLNMSRGAREGNNAFTKEKDDITKYVHDIEHLAMKWNLSLKFIKELSGLGEKRVTQSRFFEEIGTAVSYGNKELAAHFIEKEIKQGFQQFSRFFVEALTMSKDPWNGTIREASARKKADYSNNSITPMHCACINPCVKPLEALYQVCPDLFIADNNQKKLVHYAAACTEIGPINFLHKKGANLEDIDKNGLTPLMIACKVGRPKNAKFILETIKANTTEDENSYLIKKFGYGGINRPGKDSWCPLHIAVVEGNHDVVKVLLDFDANLDIALNTNHDKMTPLMLAAANGDLEMVKLLISKKAKIEKQDRYKRTAVIHAAMNGAANVLSFLLSLGADPNKLDSSQNSPLHYACAYGWWFCMQILIEAGASLVAGNEWKITPLGIAIMMGNKGISNHLLTLPGIDIDMKDDNGRTILMNMLIDQKFTKDHLSDIKELVEKRGANPHIFDNEGKNVLHHLAGYSYGDYGKLKGKQTIEETDMKLVIAIMNFFAKKGVSFHKADNHNNLPLVYALKNSIPLRDSNYNSFECKPKLVILNILEHMEKDLETKHSREEVEKNCSNLLQAFVTNVSLYFAKFDRDLFVKINAYFKSLINRKFLSKTGFATRQLQDEVSYSERKTIFGKACESYKKQAETRSYGYRSDIFSSEDLHENKQILCQILEDFIKLYSPKLQYKIPVPEKEATYWEFSSLLDSCSTKDDLLLLKMLLKYKPELEVLNSENKTPLYIMVSKKDLEATKELVAAGSNINFVHETKNKDDEVTNRECPITIAVNNSSLDIVTLLIDAKVNLNTPALVQKSLIHIAVFKCGQYKSKVNLAIVKLLLDNGCNINEKARRNRTPLHIAINLSSDDSDESLDLEILLIKRGADLYALDDHNRMPLHYAFVKMGKHTDTSSSDPIQVVSSLITEAMVLSKIDKKDIFGSTPLHYAAKKGATVCALLLLQQGADIEATDELKNTPLCNAVDAKHESCAFMLLQKGANINVNINRGLKAPSIPDHEKGLYKFFAHHWPKSVDPESLSFPLFQGIVNNDWLGITYMVLGLMDKYGLSIISVLQVAFHVQKLQFAKTLISKQVNTTLLTEKTANGRNLLNCLAFENKTFTTQSLDLQEDVFNMLVESGIPLDVSDDEKCYPLHYACLNKNKNLVELLLSSEEARAKINAKDQQGRTALAAAFWDFQNIGFIDYEKTQDSLLHLLLQHGSDINTLFKVKPFSFLQEGYDSRGTSGDYISCEFSPVQVTPLIVGILHKDEQLINFLIKKGADKTMPDSQGQIPLMYAVKTKNKEIIKKFLQDTPLEVTDNKFFNCLHHAVALEPIDESSSSFDDDSIINMIFKKSDNPSQLLTHGSPSPFQLAENIGANNIASFLAKTAGKKYEKKLMLPSKLTLATEPYKKLLNLRSFDVKLDAEKTMQLHEDELQKKMDVDEKKTYQHGCTVTDGHIYKDFDILMNKVDVGFGAWGLYNFYRIQIWKEENKDLYVLFTNWGRIETYGRGQYQNTPFSTAEEAVKEFCKIFKAKSGNDWEDRLKFVNYPKKYRLVQAEHAKKVVRPQVTFDLTTKKKSVLPKSVQSLMEKITDIQLLNDTYKREIDVDSGVIPFGRIKRDALLQAKELLTRMKPLIAEKTRLDKKKYKEQAKEMVVAILDRLGNVLNQLVKLSSEYYFLLPTRGFEYEKVKPIDDDYQWQKESRRIEYMLEFETTEMLLLGAMRQKVQVHPQDYIFKALNCKIEKLAEKSREAQYIMKYMYRSNGASSQRIENIFRVEREAETKRMQRPSNRKLLWHGTKAENMISIINKGMVINPPYAQITGRCFGDGLYFADVFDKSYDYCHGRRGHVGFLLLCDVDLGKCQRYDSYNRYAMSDKQKPKGYDSICVLGDNQPDDDMEVLVNEGYRVPLGKIVKRPPAKMNCYRFGYSEYIVFDEARVVIRYIVQLGDGTGVVGQDSDDEDEEDEEEEDEDDEDEDEDGDTNMAGSESATLWSSFRMELSQDD